MTVVGNGDQARSFVTKLASSRLKANLDVLAQEMASGQVADLTSRLKGNTRLLANIEGRISLVTQYHENTKELELFANAQQVLLEGIREDSIGLGIALISDPFGQKNIEVGTRSVEIEAAFESVIQKLNSSVGSRYLMGGTITDRPPVADPSVIMGHLEQVVQGLSTAGDVVGAISAWFDAPQGGGGYRDLAYQGGAESTTKVVIAENLSAPSSSLSAASPELVELLKGIAIAAIANRGVLTADPLEQANLRSDAGRIIVGAEESLIGKVGKIGVARQIIEQANLANEKLRASLSLARNEMRSVDLFETGSALLEVEKQLESLYAMTARMSRLKLADFLK